MGNSVFTGPTHAHASSIYLSPAALWLAGRGQHFFAGGTLQLDHIAIVRLEQQYPFPHDDFAKAIAHFPDAREVVWVQEEPQNQGAWYRLRAYLRADIPDSMVLAYAGRAISASPAVGYAAKHLAEQKQLVEEAFAPELKSGEMVVAH